MSGLRILGFDKVAQSLDARQRRIVSAVARTISIESKFAERTAKKAAPWKTGTLRAGIIPTPVKITDKEISAELHGATSYTPFQEFGTGQRGAESGYLPPSSYRADWPGIRAKKFFKKAGEEVMPRLRDGLTKALKVS